MKESNHTFVTQTYNIDMQNVSSQIPLPHSRRQVALFHNFEKKSVTDNVKRKCL
jgi:hypothetical protein